MPGELETLLAHIGQKFDVAFEPLQVDEGQLQVLTIRNMQAHLDSLLVRKAIRDPLRDLPLWVST